MIAEEHQGAGLVCRHELLQEQPAEQAREYADGEEEAGRHDTHRLPSSEMPPPGTMMWTCGWWVSAEPQVCNTVVSPTRAPRCLGSAAMVISVSAAALNRMS